jgi:hypothetical protein
MNVWTAVFHRASPYNFLPAPFQIEPKFATRAPRCPHDCDRIARFLRPEAFSRGEREELLKVARFHVANSIWGRSTGRAMYS